MEISKRITKHKLGNLDHKEGAGLDVDEDFQQILIAYRGKNMFWLLSTISVQNLWWLAHHRNEESLDTVTKLSISQETVNFVMKK